eukprot:4384302-Amphidinium_carterae.1
MPRQASATVSAGTASARLTRHIEPMELMPDFPQHSSKTSSVLVLMMSGTQPQSCHPLSAYQKPTGQLANVVGWLPGQCHDRLCNSLQRVSGFPILLDGCQDTVPITLFFPTLVCHLWTYPSEITS